MVSGARPPPVFSSTTSKSFLHDDLNSTYRPSSFFLAPTAKRAVMASKLRIRPNLREDYSEQFAKAFCTAHDKGLLKHKLPQERDVAQRVRDGEGGDLIFSDYFVRRHGFWSGYDIRLRRGAFVHIFGARPKECTLPDCPYNQSHVLSAGRTRMSDTSPLVVIHTRSVAR